LLRKMGHMVVLFRRKTMISGGKYKWIVFLMTISAVVPLVIGNAFHVIPCLSESHASDHCCSHGKEHESDTQSPPEESCSICNVLAMPRDVVPSVALDCLLDLVEHRESEPVRLFVVLYRPFEPGRAPPTLA